MAMLRDRAARARDVEARLLLSARRFEDVLYRDELMALAGGGVAIHQTLTRAQPPGWTGWGRRVDADMLDAVGPGPDASPRTYVCGPTPFVEAVASLLVGLGHRPATVKTERFGPTGG
jgi:ferredoxin-NADP reductase